MMKISTSSWLFYWRPAVSEKESEVGELLNNYWMEKMKVIFKNCRSKYSNGGMFPVYEKISFCKNAISKIILWIHYTKKKKINLYQLVTVPTKWIEKMPEKFTKTKQKQEKVYLAVFKFIQSEYWEFF